LCDAQECTREAEAYRKREDEKKEFTLSALLLEPTIRIHKYLSYFRVPSPLPPQSVPLVTHVQLANKG
jgi:hypothetical protein